MGSFQQRTPTPSDEAPEPSQSDVWYECSAEVGSSADFQEDLYHLLEHGITVTRAAKILKEDAVQVRRAAQGWVAGRSGADLSNLSAVGKQVLDRSTSCVTDNDFVASLIKACSEDAPEELIDPISYAVIRDPVMLSSGLCLDRSSAVNEHGQLRFNNCPLTRAPLKDAVYPNLLMQKKVKTFLRENLTKMCQLAARLLEGGQLADAERAAKYAEEFCAEIGEGTYFRQAFEVQGVLLRIAEQGQSGAEPTAEACAQVYIKAAQIAVATGSSSNVDSTLLHFLQQTGDELSSASGPPAHQDRLALTRRAQEALADGDVERARAWNKGAYYVARYVHGEVNGGPIGGFLRRAMVMQTQVELQAAEAREKLGTEEAAEDVMVCRVALCLAVHRAGKSADDETEAFLASVLTADWLAPENEGSLMEACKQIKTSQRNPSQPTGLVKDITWRSGWYVHNITFNLVDGTSNAVGNTPGGDEGPDVTLSPGEYIVSVNYLPLGLFDPDSDGLCKGLSLVSNTGGVYTFRGECTEWEEDAEYDASSFRTLRAEPGTQIVGIVRVAHTIHLDFISRPIGVAPGLPVNDEGAAVKLGNTRYSSRPDHPFYGARKFYCGRYEHECGRIEGSNGQCGPSGGGQCDSCRRFQANLRNDEGCPVALGNADFGSPGTLLYGGQTWYCGRYMPIPGTDGQCGPSGGPSCSSCSRFTCDPVRSMFEWQEKHKPTPAPAPQVEASEADPTNDDQALQAKREMAQKVFDERVDPGTMMVRPHAQLASVTLAALCDTAGTHRFG